MGWPEVVAVLATGATALAVCGFLCLWSSARELARHRYSLELATAVSDAITRAASTAVGQLHAATQPAPEPPSFGPYDDDGPGLPSTPDWTDSIPGLRDEDISGYPPGAVPPPPAGFHVDR